MACAIKYESHKLCSLLLLDVTLNYAYSYMLCYTRKVFFTDTSNGKAVCLQKWSLKPTHFTCSLVLCCVNCACQMLTCMPEGNEGGWWSSKPNLGNNQVGKILGSLVSGESVWKEWNVRESMVEFWHRNVLMFKAENIIGFILKGFRCSQFARKEFYVTGK